MSGGVVEAEPGGVRLAADLPPLPRYSEEGAQAGQVLGPKSLIFVFWRFEQRRIEAPNGAVLGGFVGTLLQRIGRPSSPRPDQFPVLAPETPTE